jgi:hypothetical protein
MTECLQWVESVIHSGLLRTAAPIRLGPAELLVGEQLMFLRLSGVISMAFLATAAVSTTAAWAISVGPMAADMSAEAKLYLDQAIKLLREQHINSSNLDWQALTQKAYAAASGAKKTADTYSASPLQNRRRPIFQTVLT